MNNRRRNNGMSINRWRDRGERLERLARREQRGKGKEVMTLEEIVSEDFPEERHDLIFRLKATPSTKLNQSINQSINQIPC